MRWGAALTRDRQRAASLTVKTGQKRWLSMVAAGQPGMLMPWAAAAKEQAHARQPQRLCGRGLRQARRGINQCMEAAGLAGCADVAAVLHHDSLSGPCRCCCGSCSHHPCPAVCLASSLQVDALTGVSASPAAAAHPPRRCSQSRVRSPAAAAGGAALLGHRGWRPHGRRWRPHGRCWRQWGCTPCLHPHPLPLSGQGSTA